MVLLVAIACPVALEAQTTVVTFDNPVPSGSADSYVNGIFQGINFGTSQWRWSPPWGADTTNSIYFGTNSTTRSFTFSPAPKLLSSLRVYTTSNGTLTLSDGVNPTLTRSVTTGSMQLINTGWTLGSTTFAVTFTSGWSLGIDDITHSAIGPPDTTPPSVSITAPATGANLSGIVSLTASASDNVGVFGVQFYLDGIALGAEDTTPPYSINWETATASNGPHTLIAVSRDASNNQGVSASIAVNVSNAPPTGAGFSLRFFGNGVNDIDRVKILIDDPATSTAGPPADVGATDFTVEFWLNAAAADNTAAAISCGANDNWKFGNIIVDRDRYSQDRSYGISVAGGRLAFGVTGPSGTGRATICGTTNVLDGQWHHVALQRRRSDGWLWLYVDGVLQAQGDGPDDDISYPDNGVPGNFCGPTANQPCTNSDPYLVIGAEKHDAGPLYPSYRGLFDELRLSSTLRYSVNFSRPTQPFPSDANTVALYHFDEGQGDFIGDSSGAGGGPSNGVRKLGGSPAGPQWVPSTPFTTPSAAQVGQWSGPFSWPLVTVHMALMKTGEVLMFDGRSDTNLAGPSAKLWSPATQTFTPVPNSFSNFFCGGQSILADGRLLVAGGNAAAFAGLRDTNIFDPVAATWTRAADMNYVRWYPTTVTLGDGRVLVVSGAVNCADCTSDIPEIYDPATNRWTSLPSAEVHLPLYPFLFVLPDGRVLNAGSDEDPMITRVLDVQTQTWTVVDPAVIEGGSAVMYQPGRVMKSGSASDVDRPSAPSVTTTYVLDMNGASPRWRQTTPMAFPRGHHNLTLLPDGSVLVTGGGQTTDGVNTGQAVFEAELWSPATETWTTMAGAQRPRLYHSTALLLPDGRVLSAGGGRFPGFDNIDELNAEIYSPPYLFHGARPVATSAPATIPLGASFFVGTGSPTSIARVTLLAPSAVTHSVNMHQRFLELAFQPTAGGLTVQAPANANLAPLGTYMLFLIDTNGVPSIASFVTVTPPSNPVPTTAGLSPVSATAGGAGFALTVTGAGFVPTSVVRWNGAARATSFVSATQLTATIAAGDIALQGTAAVTVLNPTPGGGTSNAQTFTIGAAGNPLPTTTGLSPVSATVGGAGFTLTVTGTGFVSTSVVRWNGGDRPTTFVSASQLTAAIAPGDITGAGTAAVTVFSPTPGGGASNAQTFTMNNPAPTTTGLSPPSATAGGAGFTLTVTGSGFVATSVVRWNGAARPTTFVSASQLTATIVPSDITGAGTAAVTVFNGTPGGGTSNTRTFTINPADNPAPTTTGLSPASATAGSTGFTLTVNGIGFVPTSLVRWNGSDRPTTFVSALQLTATIAAGDIASVGTAAVTVFSPTPGGGTSNAQTFSVNSPAPTVTGLSPSAASAGGPGFTLTVTGTGFVPMSTVRWNGGDRPTTFLSASRLTAAIDPGDIAGAGTAAVTVFSPAPGGGTSSAQTFSVNNPAPTTSVLSPSSATAGTLAFTLTLNGTGFVPASVVRWNGGDRPTTFVSASQLTVAITAADVAVAATAAVTVFSPAPGGGTSNAQTFTVNNPAPTVTGLSPASATAGAPGFTLTVSGAGFVSSSVVKLNAVSRPTTFVSPGQLTAAIAAEDIAQQGEAPVTVFDAAPGGGISGAQSFVVLSPGVGFFDAFDRPNSTSLGNGWTDKLGNAFAIQNNEVGPAATGPIDYLDAIAYRPLAEDRRDIEAGLEFRVQASQSFPQVHARVQRSSISLPGTLESYLFFVDGAEASPGRAVIARQAPVTGQLSCYLLAIPFPSPLEQSDRYRLRFSVTGSGPVTLTGSVDRLVGTAWQPFASGTATHDATTQRDPGLSCDPGFMPAPISGAGAVGFARREISNEILDNFYWVDLTVNPAPTTSGLTPASATAGGPSFTLTVNGASFVPGSIVRWAGADRPTAFVSAEQLTATISAADIAAAGTPDVTVFNPVPSGGISNAQAFAVEPPPNPVPAISALDPPSAAGGGPGFTLTVNGSGFVPGSVVRWNGTDRPTSFVSTTQVTIAIAASDIATEGPRAVTVFTPTPGGGTSNAQTFTVGNRVPTTSGLDPSSALAGGAGFTVTVNGASFVPTSVVRWNGLDRPTTFVSAGQLTATIAAPDVTTAGTTGVTVFNPAPGGGTSNPQTFTVNNPAPTATELNPGSALAGGAGFTLTVSGASFVPTSIVRWNGVDRPTTFVSAGQLTAVIAPADVAAAGPASVTVFNPTPGGGSSSAQAFAVNNAVPTTSGLNPSSSAAGGASFTLTMSGTGFVPTSVVRWNDVGRPTTFVSAGQLTAMIAAVDIATSGPASVAVFNPTPGGGVSNAQTFTVTNPAPAVAGLNPTSALAGGATLTLTVSGASFAPTSTVRWNGVDRPTTFVSAGQLTATIAAADIATAGSASVTVFTSAPGGGTSNAQTFTVNNPVPTTTALSPTSIAAGGPAFTLTVNGTGFVSTSVVRWNVANRTTTFVSSSQLTAAISASDIAAAGTATVTVLSPAPGGGTSNAQALAINNPAPATTGLNPASASAGGTAFTLTVNGTGFVPTSVVRWNGANRTTTFLSAGQLTATMPAADIAAAGTPSVTVFNAAPGGGTSNAQIFTVNNPVPTMTGLSPSAVTAGGPAFTLTVNGTGFVSTSAVRWNGVNRTTAFVSAMQLTAAIPAADIAATGTAPVTVFNSNPGGGTSNAQTLTISATPVGLVAAYSFNAGTGTTVADVSGNGNTGTINGATWTSAGRFGGALAFNGSSNMVTIADSSSLDLTVGMTLEAWVFPTATPTNGRSIIAKEQPGDIVYSLHASSRPNHRPATMVFVAGSERQLIGGTRVSTNTWVHLAATYDGTTQRLYVNGVQVASRAQTGPIVTSNSPLRIGGNAVFGEFFQGRIDEVRIYNRALSATEIQNDMTAPLGP